MIPKITDALIALEIQTHRMLLAGQDYWANGRVRQLDIAEDRNQARAFVKGTARDPYEVLLLFGKEGSDLVTDCSCPVGTGCKHVAAALFALRAALNEAASANRTTAGGSRLPFSPAPHRSPEPTIIAPPIAVLPAALSQWLNAMQPLMRETDPVSAPAPTRAIYYVIRAQALDGSARMSKKHPVESLAPPGYPLRLFVEPVDVALDAGGLPMGAPAKLPVHQFLYASSGGPAHLASIDRLLIRRLYARIGDTDQTGCLTGEGGFDLLARMIATGRARWGSQRGPALYQGPSISCPLRWEHDEHAHAHLSLVVPERAIVGLLAPPVVIDGASGAVSSLDADLTPAMAEQLLRLPGIAPDAVDVLAARWSEVAPPHVPPPIRPEIRELGQLTPVPVLLLRIERVEMEELYGSRSRYSYARKTKVDCAVARLIFDYGVATVEATTTDQTMLIRDGDALIRFARDFAAENAANERLIHTNLIPLIEFEETYPSPSQEWDYAPLAPARAEDFTGFLVHEADQLRSDGWRIELTSTFPLQLVQADPDSGSIELIPSGIDWFDVELGVTIDGERVDLVPALRRLLGSLNSTENRDLVAALALPGSVLPVALGDGRVVTVEAERILPMLRALLLLAAHQPPSTPTDEHSRFSRHDLGLLAELETATLGLQWTGADALRRLSRALTELSFEPTALPVGFDAKLRPYQQIGLDWLEALGRAGIGGLLADDMGLGKTVQTLAHLAVLKTRGELEQPVLIVAPTSVLPNWQAEIARFSPDLSTLLLHGPDRHDRHDAMAAHDIVLTSYPLLVRDREQLAKETFALIVFDEAHNLKNPRTAGHAAARAMTASRKIALTGTPVENHLTDAWALFDLIIPGLLGNQRTFLRDYRTPIEKHGDATAKARLARKLKPFLLRRTKEAVAPDLPAKSVVPLMITLDPAQMALHESQRLLMQKRIRDEIARVGLMRAQIIVLTALTRLRQICCDPRLIHSTDGKVPPSSKLNRLLELLEEMIEEGRRIILFSQFTSMLDLIKPELNRRGFGWVELTGQTKDRQEPVARFQSGAVPLILVSLKAGGTGLNLTAADTVLLYDPWWNPAVEAQAIDRAHRIGQSKPIFVYRMIAADTIEEKILALQQRKAGLAEALWSADTTTPAHLTEDDIAFLLG
jgi:superfamily II DNA or RNA helicase